MELISDINNPWIVLSDFSVVTSQDEKIGGRSPNKTAILDFTTCLNNCELIDAPKIRLQHFWSNFQHGKWLQRYIDWGYKVGLRMVFDHDPLLGGCASIPKPKNAPKIFQKMWISHPNFLQVMSECWLEKLNGDHSYIFLQKLKKLKRVLNYWNWNVFINVQVKLKKLKKK
ncbi:uncharacterized protein LOC113312325 [Papaver somniferum]|uniref:uncharacterized protein LOC113312325 n=1 Tax=Papaver somniferum TaxID=3469 RepID=UPI000E6F69D0|nr:uncharacterized protein LOC113312325 [Papaver somniferum]